ncbi:Prefoldin subunit 6 [Conoideocrella luteorostrata]|uniref:Prefoldin subunit 6 n=1 Tax=Conoideocrella luteorostrata TaxID=1105319 RepID=A0AAJ0CIU8_9HYPO|nr:Prefoldin subunit 6 [Conoideocrella luteorostrata]
MAEVQAKLQALSEDYQKLQQELQDTVNSRQRFQSQQQENAGVYKQEFENLGEDETIYKLMGPVLLKQDKVEAESTVKGRLDFISGEVARLEGQIKETQGKLDKKKTEIIQLQSSAQASSGGKAQQPAE